MSYTGNNIQYDSLLRTGVKVLKDYILNNTNSLKSKNLLTEKDILYLQGITGTIGIPFLNKLFNINGAEKIIKEFFNNINISKQIKSIGYYGLLFHYITDKHEHEDTIDKIKREFGRQNANGETLMKILINENKVQKFITDKNFQNSRRKLLKAIIKKQTKTKKNLDNLKLDTLEELCNNIFENNILKDVFFIEGGNEEEVGNEEKVKKEIKDKLIISILTEDEHNGIKREEEKRQQIKSELHEHRNEQYKQVSQAMKESDIKNKELISNAKDEVLVKEVMEKDAEEIKNLKAQKEEEQKIHIEHTRNRVKNRKKKANPQEQETETSEPNPPVDGGRRTRKRKGRKGRKSKKQRKGRKGRKKARKTKRKNGRKTKRKHSRKTKRKYSHKSKINRTRKLKKHHHKGGDDWSKSTADYTPGSPLGKYEVSGTHTTDPDSRQNVTTVRVPNKLPEERIKETYHRTIVPETQEQPYVARYELQV